MPCTCLLVEIHLMFTQYLLELEMLLIFLRLSEAYRVLKPGGRLMILEFSSVNNDIISWFYEKYSFNIIPN